MTVARFEQVFLCDICRLFFRRDSKKIRVRVMDMAHNGLFSLYAEQSAPFKSNFHKFIYHRSGHSLLVFFFIRSFWECVHQKSPNVKIKNYPGKCFISNHNPIANERTKSNWMLLRFYWAQSITKWCAVSQWQYTCFFHNSSEHRSMGLRACLPTDSSFTLHT